MLALDSLGAATTTGSPTRLMPYRYQSALHIHIQFIKGGKQYRTVYSNVDPSFRQDQSGSQLTESISFFSASEESPPPSFLVLAAACLNRGRQPRQLSTFVTIPYGTGGLGLRYDTVPYRTVPCVPPPFSRRGESSPVERVELLLRKQDLLKFLLITDDESESWSLGFRVGRRGRLLFVYRTVSMLYHVTLTVPYRRLQYSHVRGGAVGA